MGSGKPTRQQRRRAARRSPVLEPVSFGVSDGSSVEEECRSSIPRILHSQLSKTQLKLLEAQYFHSLLLRNLHHEGAVLFHFSALLSAMRSVTFVLRKEGAQHAEFEAWYAKKQAQLAGNVALATLKNLRNESLKEGLVLPKIRIKRRLAYHSNGAVEEHYIYDEFFVESPNIQKELPPVDTWLDDLVEIVEEAGELGFLTPGRKQQLDFAFQFWSERPDGKWMQFEAPDPFRPPRAAPQGLPRQGVLDRLPEVKPIQSRSWRAT